jgi:membrane-bound lytic murein transglycosylase MltF
VTHALVLSPKSVTPHHGDFDEIVETGQLRVLVAADLGFYYIESGRPKGIIAEQLYHFEKHLKQSNPLLNIQIIPVQRDDLIPTLKAGFGDLAVANLTITEPRQQVIDFSNPILSNIQELIITHKSVEDFTSIEQLSGEEVWIRASSSYFESVQAINAQLNEKGIPPINVNFIEETLQDYELVEMVNQGYISATIMDSHKTELWLKVMDGIKVHRQLPLRIEGKVAWAHRKESPKLHGVVNSYLKSAKKGTLLGNVIYEKYIDDTRWLSRALSPDKVEKLDGLATVFQKYAEQYQIDWLMLSAQAFQESGLDNSKVSHRGAVGIMQVLPATAKDSYINIPDIKPLDNNVHAGTKYMRFIHDRYFGDDAITENNKVYFSLASYNAGPAKIRKMRQLAAQQGFDPNVWFKNVEIVARKNIGTEPVKYVANINRYYVIYKQLGLIQKDRADRNLSRVYSIDGFTAPATK